MLLLAPFAERQNHPRSAMEVAENRLIDVVVSCSHSLGLALKTPWLRASNVLHHARLGRIAFKTDDDDKEDCGSDLGNMFKEQLDERLKKSKARGGFLETLKAARPGYDPQAFRAPFFWPTFSRRREVFVGRIAMIGFFAALIGEVATGAGPVGQVQLWTGLSEATIVQGIWLLAFSNLVAGLWPTGPTYSPQNLRDIMKRPDGPPFKWVNPLTKPGQFFGAGPWGFNKRNELLHGRLAMLGFMAAVMAETVTGYGAIGQLAWWFGATPVTPDWYSGVMASVVAFAVGATGYAFAKQDFGQSNEANEGIY